jgi:hypothetical protein
MLGVAGLLVVPLAVAACTSSPKAAPVPSSTVALATTTLPPLSNLSVQGVKPGVLQAPFYPMVTVSTVSCGTGPGGRFVRLDLPAGPAGTPAQTGLSQPTYVIVLPGKAELRDGASRVLYRDPNKGIAPATRGSLVLALIGAGENDVQVNGGYTCPDTDVAYPGT